MATSSPWFHAVWASQKLVGIQAHEVGNEAIWIHPVRIQAHELGKDRRWFTTMEPIPTGATRTQKINTHLAIQPEERQDLWVVDMRRLPPDDYGELYPEYFAMWVASVDALKAMLAFVPVEQWDPAVFRPTMLGLTP